MKHFIKLFLALIMCVAVSSCHGVRPEADEEAVLIKSRGSSGMAVLTWSR